MDEKATKLRPKYWVKTSSMTTCTTEAMTLARAYRPMRRIAETTFCRYMQMA